MKLTVEVQRQKEEGNIWLRWNYKDREREERQKCIFIGCGDDIDSLSFHIFLQKFERIVYYKRVKEVIINLSIRLDN